MATEPSVAINTDEIDMAKMRPHMADLPSSVMEKHVKDKTVGAMFKLVIVNTPSRTTTAAVPGLDAFRIMGLPFEISKACRHCGRWNSRKPCFCQAQGVGRIDQACRTARRSFR